MNIFGLDLLELVKLLYTSVPIEIRFVYTFWILLGGLYLYSDYYEKLQGLSKKGKRKTLKWNLPLVIWLPGIACLLAYLYTEANGIRLPVIPVFLTSLVRLVAVIGYLLLALGLWIACWGRASLNSYWGSNIYVYDPPGSEKLQTQFAYNRGRHPIYFGQMLMVFGTFFVSNSFVWLPFPLLFVIITSFRIHNEEEHLKKQFNGEYEKWRDSKPIFPFLG